MVWAEVWWSLPATWRGLWVLFGPFVIHHWGALVLGLALVLLLAWGRWMLAKW